MSNKITPDEAIRAANTILKEAGLSLEELVARQCLTWHLCEDTVKDLSQFMGDDEEPMPITLSVGPAELPDGEKTVGLRCWSRDYPEEGYILLSEMMIPVINIPKD